MAGGKSAFGRFLSRVTGNSAAAGNAPAPAAAPQEAVLSEYEIGPRLGEGGYGSVYLATSKLTGERYAMKEALVAGAEARQEFLSEIEAWMNLPPYPHVAACRFFKLGRDSVYIFAELAENGSLADRVRSGRLYEGGADAALDRILRIAIQSAWGLECAHRFGLVHQDVKPSNLLLAAGDVVKVADFGLTEKARPSAESEAVLEYLIQDIEDPAIRARLLSPLREQLNAGEASKVMGKGSFTAQYAPPEQLSGKVLTPATDVWSWGLSVLELFAGGCRWELGSDAPAVLAAFAGAPSREGLPALAPSVAAALARCFAEDPAERWSSMADAAAAFAACWQESFGSVFPLAMPPFPDKAKTVFTRQLSSGSNWDDPREWLAYAYQEQGRDQAEAMRHWPDRTGTATSQAVSDFQALEHALKILEVCGGQANPERVSRLARLHGNLANVAAYLGDNRGALEHYEQGAALLAAGEGSDDLRMLATLWNSHAILLRKCDRVAESIALCDRAIDFLRTQTAEERASLLALLLNTKANSLLLSDAAAALPFCQEAVELEVCETPARATYLTMLASVYTHTGDSVKGAQTEELAQAMLTRMIEQDRRLDLRPKLALLLLNRAIAAQERGEFQTAFSALEESIAKLLPLVTEEGQWELADDLGSAYFRRALALEGMGRVRDALASYAIARERLSEIVLERGRSEFVEPMAAALRNEANLTLDVGDAAEALRLAENAVNLMKRLVQGQGGGQWASGLARVQSVLCACLVTAGRVPEAVAVSCEAVAIFRAMPAESLTQHAREFAAALLEHAVALRRAGEGQAAWNSYQEALVQLRDQPDTDSLAMKGVILGNCANLLGDANEFGQSLQFLDEALEVWNQLSGRMGPMFHHDDVVMAHKARTNQLLKFGAYAEALASADRTLPMMEEMIEKHGRGDLREEYGKLVASRAMIAKKLGDLPAAIASFERAQQILSAAPARRHKPGEVEAIVAYFQNQVGELRKLAAVAPKDFAQWSARAEEKIQLAGQFGRAGDTFQACEILDEAILIYFVLDQKGPDAKWLESLANTYLRKGVAAMHAHRDAASETSFRNSMTCYEALVQRTRRKEKLADWGNAALGLAMFLESSGRTPEREALQAQAAARLRSLNEAAWQEWNAKLTGMLRQG